MNIKYAFLSLFFIVKTHSSNAMEHNNPAAYIMQKKKNQLRLNVFEKAIAVPAFITASLYHFHDDKMLYYEGLRRRSPLHAFGGTLWASTAIVCTYSLLKDFNELRNIDSYK